MDCQQKVSQDRHGSKPPLMLEVHQESEKNCEKGGNRTGQNNTNLSQSGF
jgi:hypothetical protein